MSNHSSTKSGISLRWQICLLIASLLMTSLSIFGIAEYRDTRRLVTSLRMDLLQAQTRDVAARIESAVTATRLAVSQVENFPPVQSFVLSADEDLDITLDDDWRRRMTAVLENQLRGHESRAYCSLLDVKGRELVRVEASDDRPVTVARELLGDRSDDDHFTQVFKARSDVYVSPMRLRRDRGKVIAPIQPLVHVCTLLRNSSDEIRGVFVIALDGNRLLSISPHLIQNATIDVVDDQGVYLACTDPGRLFGLCKGHTARFIHDYPVRGELLADGSDANDTYADYIPGSDRRDGRSIIGIYHKIYYDSSDRTRFWAIAPTIDASVALAPASDTLRHRLILTLVTMLVTGGLAFVISRGLTSSLTRLADSADRIRSGDYDTPMPEIRTQGTEVRMLYDSVRTMTDHLRETIRDQANQRHRTKAIVNAMADGLVAFDEQGIVVWFNTAATKLFGYAVDEAVGESVSVLIPTPNDLGRAQFVDRYLEAGDRKNMGRERRDLELVHKDGFSIPISLKVSQMVLGDERLYVALVRDISDRMRVESQRNDLFVGIQDAVQRLSSGSDLINHATAEQAHCSEQQAAAVSEVVSTVDEIAQAADQAADRARSVGESIQRNVEIGHQGRAAVDEAIAAMTTAKQQVQSIANHILTLSEHAQAIGQIIATANDIAEQTHLLALNASIEASHAGDRGQGFAVVAREIKALAAESKQSTEQVHGILTKIKDATRFAVTSTEKGTQAANEAAHVVARAGDTINTLSDTLATTAKISAQIVASAGQQAMGMVQVNEALQNVDEIAQENIRNVYKVEETATNLEALSDELNKMTESRI